MASILLSHTHPHKSALTLTRWVRTLAPPTPAVARTATNSAAAASCASVSAVAVMKKGPVINRRSGGDRDRDRERDRERISVWWRDGWRLISCADFGWGGAQDKAISGKKAAFSDSASNKEGSNMGEEDHQQQHPPTTKLLTIPTILTLGRVAAIPILVSTFYSNNWWATTLTTSIFVVAAITDWLDGYIARKMRLGTPFGAFLDPVADKLMVAATLVLLCTRPLEVGGFGEIPWLLPIPSIAIIGREITMSAVREWAASQNGKVLEAVAVNSLGKWKTATQMTALTILLVTRDTSITGSHILVPGGVGLLYISAGLSVWSLFVYMRKIWRVLLKL